MTHSHHPTRRTGSRRPLSATFRAVAAAGLLGAAAAHAHVTLPPGGAAAGSDYEAAFRVGHACKDAKATTGIVVRLPRGVTLVDARARPGWKLDVQKSGGDGFGEVAWQAESPQAALPGSERAEFVVRTRLPAAPGVLWFKVLQRCDVGSADWAQLPANGAATDGLERPAARLDVLAPGVAAVDVKEAWVRAAVPGQSGTGAFMKLNAPSGARLVGASTPAAGIAEIHEMKMEGDTMRMRQIAGVDLPPRQTVELKPGGYHLMLMDLKQPIARGGTVPVTLDFQDAAGRKSTITMQLPVQAAASGPAEEHKH